MLLVTGEVGWCESWVSGRLANADAPDVLWVADRSPPGWLATPVGRVAQRLGSEYRLLVFNAYDGFHPDAFAAAIGTLRGGGDCVLLAPPLGDWAAFADPDKARFACYPHAPAQMQGYFLARLAARWWDHPATRVVTANDPGDLMPRLAPDITGQELQLTAEQQTAVAAVERVSQGHARRPLVISADRGRGKSTLLGVVAARLLLGGLGRVTVVAPHRAAAATLFRQALAAAGLPDHGVADTPIGDGLLCFRLPAECMAAGAEPPGLVMVDEAAGIPVAVLRRLLDHSNRLVFATTVHGYEGSGRGFELRFKAVLDEQMPQWRALQLTTPVRWAAGDPLEELLNDAFLLDAEPVAPAAPGELSIARVGPALLADDEGLLRATLGLLIAAHYQTRPSDLRQLLDNPTSHLWLARRGAAVVGVLLVSEEGGLDDVMVGRVVSGERRLRGHLLPQSLAVHAGLDDCLRRRALRVQRIAVHPLMRRRGIGRRLLEGLADWGRDRQFDLLGCAFAAEPALLAFWRSMAFMPVRLGVRLDPASAAHSLFMLRGLNDAGRALASHGARRFRGELPWSLGADLRDLDSVLAVELLRGRDCADLALDQDDRRALARIADGSRQPATATAPLWKALVKLAAQGDTPPAPLAPLIAFWLQRQSPEQLCRLFSVCGRRALDDRLRMVLDAQRATLLPVG